MSSNDIRNAQVDIQVGVRAVIDPDREIPIERVALEFDAVRYAGDGTSAASQLILVDVVIFKAETPAGNGGVAHGAIGVQRAAARCTSPGSGRSHCQTCSRDSKTVDRAIHEFLRRP